MPRPDGIWVTYDPKDFGHIVLHRTEMAALRHAVARGHRAEKFSFGKRLFGRKEADAD